MAQYKNKSALHKRKSIYKIELSKTITDSSSTPETEEQKKRREDHAAQMARRRAISVQKSEDKVNQKYDLMALYHQLNYNVIKDTIAELGVKPSIINNSYLLIVGLNYDMSNKVKDALLECHYETKTGKQYKIRVAVYKQTEKTVTTKCERKPSNNNPNVAAKTKEERKAVKKNAFTSRKQHEHGRKENKVSHRPAVIDTAGILKKISIRAKKACAYLEKKEREAKIQASHLANIKEKHSKKPIQKIINFSKQ